MIRPGQTGVFKTNTVLAYDDNLNLLAWGYPALAEEPSRKQKKNQTKAQSRPVELFKLHLANNIKDDEKPPLPLGLDFKRVITDYLHQMNKSIADVLNTRWPGLKYPQQVRYVISVPAEW
nr:13557_t:CDS:2 [Entrophospora candida]